MKRRIIGYYDYTVILTYCGMLSALIGVFKVLGGEYIQAAVCLMIAGGCDMFDGLVASTKDRNESQKCFGIQIDSLSDLISFGILPGIFVYCIMERTVSSAIICSVFVLCALIRLAYFNVLEAERQKQTTERRKSYLGVPVTTIALLLPAVCALVGFGAVKYRVIFEIVLLAAAIGFVAPVDVKKPHTVGKAVMVAIGIAEMAGLIILMGAGRL